MQHATQHMYLSMYGSCNLQHPSLSTLETVERDAYPKMPKENMSVGAMGYALLLLLYLSDSAKSIPQKTLVVYSGPTSLNRHDAKNGIYHDNMMYFLEHGISCSDDDPGSNSDSNAESVIVNYAFVLTQEVADYYTGPNGPMAKKIQECEGGDKDNREYDTNIPFIRVMTRQDRCYDMESIWIVANSNVLNLYDNVVFINCGMVGPKLGPGSPRHIHSSSTMKENEGRAMVPYSHWSQLYTSGLTDSIRLVGHSINTHCHGLGFSPHIQSFLYAMRTDTVPMLLSSGAIYDCGLSQEQLGSNKEIAFDLIKRYEVGRLLALLLGLVTPNFSCWTLSQVRSWNEHTVACTGIQNCNSIHQSV